MKRKSCLLIILIIALFICIINLSKNIKVGKMPLGSVVCSQISKPFVYSGKIIRTNFSKIYIYFQNKNILIERINELEKENILLNAENDSLREMAYKSQELEKLLNFSPAQNYERKGARILYYSPTHWYKKATIDLGLNQGAKLGGAVIDSKGLLGQICEISKNSAVIESITNEKTAIGGKINNKDVKGLVIGDGSDTLLFTYLKIGCDIKKGDIVYTYGDGSLIPSNIPIGTIKNIKEDKLTNSVIASIEPISDFNSPNYVYILTGPK